MIRAASRAAARRSRLLLFLFALAACPPSLSAAGEARGARLAAKSLLLDGAAVGSRLVAVGARGHALFSTDGGASWKRARVPVRVLLTAVRMIDARAGWAVGHEAVILRTEDGGASWRAAHHAPGEDRPLLDVWFRDARAGFAVGAYGYFLATADGGRTWTPRTIADEDVHLNALAPAGPRRLFVAGEAGALYRSDDGGETWRKMPSPYAGSWFAALALDENRVLLAGLRGRLFRSEDGGETWTRTPTGTKAALTSIVRMRPGLLLITGLEGVLLVSRDGGRSASTDAAFPPLASRQGVSTALPLPGGGALLLGEFGVRRLPGAG